MKFLIKHTSRLLSAAVFAGAMYACSSVKHVPDGEYLLDRVDIAIARDTMVGGHPEKEIETAQLYNFLRQQPNHKVLGFAKLQLATYSLSGHDTTRWYNRWLRRLGQPPVIYDSQLAELSRRQLLQAMINRGYMDATVELDSTLRPDKKKAALAFTIHPGKPYTIRTLNMDSPDPVIGAIVKGDSANSTLIPGGMFDRNVLDAERTRLATLMRNRGYYGFNREYITFVADTAANSTEIDLTMVVQEPRDQARVKHPHRLYRIRDVYFDTDYNGITSGTPQDTVTYHGYRVLYGRDHYLRPAILEEKCLITPGSRYNLADVEKTYENLAQLGILKFINIEMKPVATVGDEEWLDCYIMLSRNKKQSVAVELEGTNSEGDLGVGLGLTYQHRNLARGSQLLTAKVRGSYESLSGDVEGLINNRYTEVAGEVGLTFPRFEAPFLHRSFKQRIRAVSELSVSANYQERPEYTRVMMGAAWKYRWTQRRPGSRVTQNTLDLLDINYVYLPHSTINFLDEIAPQNPLLRYSYEDHFIMRLGYRYYHTNRRIPTANVSSFAIQPTITTTRASVETAGNVLYAISKISGQHRHGDVYKVFGIQYAQYVKGDVDFTHVINLNARNAVAFHGGFGIGYPYGNSQMIPFEKRFYAGGANSVRGWNVRTLGPGAYRSRNNVLNFINQCGDISLNLSAEYRAKLFWVFEGALFVDAGNIWTIKNYENQPDGLFRFRNFAREIAAGYGLGLRMDFTYFLLRLDLGMKAHNPATGEERWPIVHPKWGRDHCFHFAVGYPF